jgi:hypothetical protein
MRTPEVSAYGGSRSGSHAGFPISGVAEFATPLACKNDVTSQPVRPATTKLNINVTTTSSTFHRARSQPGTALTAIPAVMPASIAAGIASGPPTCAATVAEISPPKTNPPSTPTLNTPARNAIAVAKPVNSRGVAALSVAAIRSIPPKASRPSN